MISIGVFNNKGGVGKTTLLCNLAAYYSIKKGKRVLVIDADPQCNASTYLLSDNLIESLYSDNSVNTLYDYIEPYQTGDDKIPLPIIESAGFNVYLVLGDTRIAYMEDFLSGEWADTSNAIQRSIRTVCFLKQLYHDIQDSYDYVFIDVGPSLGVMNRLVLLFSDCFIMPTSSDIFCLRAVDNISKSLVQWVDAYNKLQEKYYQQKNDYYKIAGANVESNPKFLGFVNQQYTSRTRNGVRQPVKAYDEIISKLPDLMQEKMKSFYPDNLVSANLKIGDIPNFNSLIPMSQTAHKAVFELKGEDGVLGAHFAKVDEYESVISSIVTNIERNLGYYEMA